jgi:regulator of sirC expression with transglutaminase-like and TPR domain
VDALSARALFDALVQGPGEPELLRAALAIAAEEHPGLDVDAEAARILAAADGARLPAGASDEARLARLDERFYGQLGFDGERCDFSDPESSFLDSAFARRTGLPIAVATLWVELGRAAGLACEGVGFPGHFIARVRVAGEWRYVDPFLRGRRLDDEALAARVERAARGGKPDPRWLEPSGPRDVLARMLRNLKGLYVRGNDLPRAFSAADRLLAVTPDALDDRRDRGLIAMQLGGAALARQDLEAYLAVRAQAPDAGFVRAALLKLGRARTLAN